jgi:hypothetical protein
VHCGRGLDHARHERVTIRESLPLHPHAEPVKIAGHRLDLVLERSALPAAIGVIVAINYNKRALALLGIGDNILSRIVSGIVIGIVVAIAVQVAITMVASLFDKGEN